MDGIRKIGLRFALFFAFLMALGGIFGATPAAAQTGGVALWTATVGTGNEDVVRGVATDDQGNVYVAGSVNTRNAFLVRYNAAGATLWAKSFTGSGVAQANDVAVGAGGSAFVIGTFAGQIDFDPDPNATYHLNSNEDSEDIFLLKLDSGGRFVWAIGLGSKQSDSGEAVFVNRRGFVYTTGSFEESMDADPNPNKEYLLYSEGDDDIFVIRYNNDGTLARAWSMGGDDDAIGRDIAADGGGNVYIAGDFLGKIDLDQDELEDEQRSAGKEDIFLVKYNDNAGWTWSIVVGGREEDERPAVALDEAGDVYLTGDF